MKVITSKSQNASLYGSKVLCNRGRSFFMLTSSKHHFGFAIPQPFLLVEVNFT